MNNFSSYNTALRPRQILRATAQDLFFQAGNFRTGETLSDYVFRASLQHKRGQVYATLTEGAGITRIQTGIIISLTAAQTSLTVGDDYVLVLETKLTTGKNEREHVIPISILNNLIV
jgi:hypothetical protein